MSDDTAHVQLAYASLLRRKRLYSGVILAVFVMLMVAGFNIANDRNAGGFWAGLPSLFDFPLDVFADTVPKISQLPGHLLRFFPVLIETINIAAVSTLIGVALAVVLALFSTHGLAPWPRMIPVFRRLMDAMRALPEIVIALVLIFVLGGGPVPAMIAIALHTAGALGKLFSEVNENADLKPVEGLASVGANWLQRMWLGVLPQVAPNYFSYALLRFEINIRASSILGFVGAGGLGYELKNAISWGLAKYDEAAAIFILLFVTIVVVDQISSLLRNRLTIMDGLRGTTRSTRISVQRFMQHKRLSSLVYPCAAAVYLGYIFFAFDLPGLAERARWENAQVLIRDSWSHKTHITRDNRTGIITAAIEGERKGLYPDEALPDWVTRAGQATEVDLGDGHTVTFLANNALTYDVPDFGTITASVEGREVVTNLGDTPPDWVSVSATRLAITTDRGRVSLTRNRTEVFRYFPGWELFFFTFESPYYGQSIFSILFGSRIDPVIPNISGAWRDFWGNEMWRHSDVAWAIGETILMAFLGTFGAALIALPLGFLSARRFSSIWSVRFALRRLFDFLRGVDGLIWTIALSRPFGPGPLTGALAILLTDIGNFGKLFREALENVETSQIDGVKATGANRFQVFRFGVIPQVAPVLMSQVLYSLESNVRSATIIGAISGGGIGLLLTQAIITQKDWEEVTYYILLIILMVSVMDSVSSKLRRLLIDGKTKVK